MKSVAVERSIIKAALNIALNAESRKSAEAATEKELRKEGLKLPNGLTMEMIFNSMNEEFKSILDWFYTAKWGELQFLDSQIVEEVMLHFVKIKRPILSVHDSFIVWKEDESILREQMIEHYKSILGTEYEPVVGRA